MKNKTLVKGKVVIRDAGYGIRDAGIIILCVLCASAVLYAADDVKIKLTDNAGASNFAIQDSETTAVFRVNSAGHTQLLNQAQLRLFETTGSGTNYIGIRAPTSLSTDYTYTFPSNYGTDGFALTTDGLGLLSWSGVVTPTRAINTTSPLGGGGNLSADLTISIQVANGSQNGYLSSSDWNTFSGKLSSVSGTADRISVSGGSTIDIAATYVGQNTITTLGTIGTGIWQGTDIAITDGGTGAGTAQNARLNILPSVTSNANKFLQVNSGATDVQWTTLAGGGDMLKSTYDPNDDGIIGVAQGGTNSSSLTQDKFLYFNGTSIVASVYTNTDFATSGHNHTGTYEPSFTTLGIGDGGTNSSSFSGSNFLYYDGTKIAESVFTNTDFAAVSHNHDASNINAGTLSTDRYSAYGDLSAETKIGTGSTQVAAGDHNHTGTYEPSFTTLGIGDGGTNSSSFSGSNFLYYDGSKIAESAFTNTNFATSGHTHAYEPAFGIGTWAGTTNITTLGTIGTGTWNATDIALADGGTNASLTASNGGVVYSTASAMGILAGTATAQKLLMSQSSTSPVWSTPTYPNLGTTGKILIGDGTNIVLSTPTFPNAATATGSILRADGTNWVASTPTFPNTANLGKVLRGDGTNWLESTTTYPDTTTSGDILYASANNTLTTQAIGNAGQVLTVSSNQPTWVTPVTYTVITLFAPSVVLAKANIGLTYVDLNPNIAQTMVNFDGWTEARIVLALNVSFITGLGKIKIYNISDVADLIVFDTITAGTTGTIAGPWTSIAVTGDKIIKVQVGSGTAGDDPAFGVITLQLRR